MSKRLTTEEFISKAIKIHGDRFDYSKVKYTDSKSKVTIICIVHGVFTQNPSNHLHGTACPQCNIDNRTLTTKIFIQRARVIHNDKYDYSKGETAIRTILERLNIHHIQEYTFKDCIAISKLRYDFYIPSHNLLIEYDGIQHFQPIELFGGVEYHTKVIEHDNIKTEYAMNTGYNLIRIPYYDFDNIESILTKQFNDDLN